jgi:hypothetical protein
VQETRIAIENLLAASELEAAAALGETRLNQLRAESGERSMEGPAAT